MSLAGNDTITVTIGSGPGSISEVAMDVAGNGIITTLSDTTISDCDITAAETGISIPTVNYTMVRGCRIQADIGINDAGTASTIEGNKIDADSACIQLVGNHARVIGNQLENADSGVHDLSAFYSIIVGNNITNITGIVGSEWAIRVTGVGAVIADNIIELCNGGIEIQSNQAGAHVTDNIIHITDEAPGIRFSSDGGIIAGNYVKPGNHGIEIAGNDNVIEGNIIDMSDLFDDDTWDGVFIDDGSERNLIEDNRIIGTVSFQPRYGINISTSGCIDNVYVGNFAVTADFGTAPYNDAGTGTQNTYPSAGGAQGDNFV